MAGDDCPSPHTGPKHGGLDADSDATTMCGTDLNILKGDAIVVGAAGPIGLWVVSGPRLFRDS